MGWIERFSPSARHVLSFMVFWGQMQNYMMRVNLNLLIVEMVRDPRMDTVDLGAVANKTESTCVQDSMNLTSLSQEDAKYQKEDENNGFDWDEYTRGIVMSAFSYGYLTTQILGGRLTEYFGVKKVYGFSLFGTAVLTLLSPVVAKADVWAFFALRVLQGVCEGSTFPALHAMTARWIPSEERNSFIARSYFGSVFGLIITFPMCGAITHAYGWEAAFYTIGCITAGWYIFWLALVYDTPEQHPRISQTELQHIKSELGDTVSAKPLPIPWKGILTSIPFYGMLITDVGNTWGIVTLGSNGPSYLKFMLGVDIKTNGILSGLPMMCRYFGGVIHAYVADMLLHRKILSVLWVRRIFNSICQCGPALAMLILSFPPEGYLCDAQYVTALLCMGMFFNGALSSGHFSTPVDLAPNYAGTLFGISNTFSGGGTGFLVPTIIGILTQDNMTFAAWRTVFCLASGIYFFTNIFYFFMISGDVQPWNYYHQVDNESTEECTEQLAEKSNLMIVPSKAVQEDTSDI